MTEIGTCYLFVGSPRNTLFPDLAKFLRLNVTFKNNKDPHYLEAFPLHKAPVFESKDGWKLHEAICIADYFVSLKPANCTYNFFGHSERDRAKVLQWISFSFSDCVMAFVLLMIAKDDEAKKSAWGWINRNVGEFEDQLKKTPYLTGWEKTLADAAAAQYFIWGLTAFWDKEWLSKHPVLQKWFRDIVDNDEIVSQTYKGFQPKK